MARRVTNAAKAKAAAVQAETEAAQAEAEAVQAVEAQQPQYVSSSLLSLLSCLINSVRHPAVTSFNAPDPADPFAASNTDEAADIAPYWPPP